MDILKTWVTLCEGIGDLTEKECWDALKREQKGQHRVQFLLRLYGRANKLRFQRERRELLKG